MQIIEPPGHCQEGGYSFDNSPGPFFGAKSGQMGFLIAKPIREIFNVPSLHWFGLNKAWPAGGRLALAVFFLAFSLGGIGAEAFGQASVIDWSQVSKIKPNLRVIVLVQSDRPLELEDLSSLANSGLSPADRDAGLILGLRKAAFKTTLRQWMEKPPLPAHLHGALLERFRMTGIYRVGFEVMEKEYRAPLYFEVTMPRSGFGQLLLSSDHLTSPSGESAIRVDSAQNRWLCINYPEVRTGQKIKFQFGFAYQANMGELLAHDLQLADKPHSVDLPAEIKVFLEGGYKIDPAFPDAVRWAQEGKPAAPDARREYARLSKFLQKSVTYDKKKRGEYFGGRSVYSSMEDMYQDPAITLNRGVGACPDTVLLECTFLRASGIPCRTAGRFGHFFSQLYLAGQGWVSTSVTPTGIPLIVSGGPDHVPYQKWIPRIPLRTTQWEASVRITAIEKDE